MSVSGSNASTTSKRKWKTSNGSRTDVGWEHGIEVGNDSKTIQCKYCAKVVTGGVYRLKNHLAGTNKNVSVCKSVPDDVKKRMIEVLVATADAKETKKMRLYDTSVSEPHSEPSIGKGKETTAQTTLNKLFKKDLRRSACKRIAKWFYTSGIPFNTVRNPEFVRACEEIARHGLGFKAPSYHEIRETFLIEEMKETEDLIEGNKAEWRKVGCTIMSDAWTDKKRRSICNFLVNSPKGTVFLESIDASAISKTAEKVFKMLDKIIDKVGEENVVQVVTDNDAAYKAAGSMLMEKRKHLFWTPCAAHCIDLMLEDFEKKLKTHRVTIRKGRKITTYIYGRTNLISILKYFTQGRDLIRPAVTRFATAYLTLSCLSEHKGSLITMFSSSKWKETKFARSEDGKRVQNIVLDSRFWSNVLTCLRAALPLIKVLRLVDSDEKPAMPFLYEEMDCAKEKIQSNFNNTKARYEPIWKIIDERWNKQLHRPLHAAAHYLNPRIHYRASFNPNDKEVKGGLFDTIDRLVEDRFERHTIISQLDEFHHGRGLFSRDDARALLEKKHPADWWNTYGDDVPELQKFAIRVLSLTCSSSGCERNWSAFEMVHTKKRNRLLQKKMNDLVYVMYNSKLKDRKFRSVEMPVEEINSDDEWITERGVNPNEEEDVEIGENVAGEDDLEMHGSFSDDDALDASDASQQDVQDVDEDEEVERSVERVEEDDDDDDDDDDDEGSYDGLDPNANIDDLS